MTARRGDTRDARACRNSQLRWRFRGAVAEVQRCPILEPRSANEDGALVAPVNEPDQLAVLASVDSQVSAAAGVDECRPLRRVRRPVAKGAPACSPRVRDVLDLVGDRAATRYTRTQVERASRELRPRVDRKHGGWVRVNRRSYGLSWRTRKYEDS